MSGRTVCAEVFSGIPATNTTAKADRPHAVLIAAPRLEY
jgi:hypothetical protein